MYVEGVIPLLNTNITNLRLNIYDMLEQTVKYNVPINVSTKHGNAVLLSEEDYNGLMATLHFDSVPGMKERIVDGLKTPLKDCLSEDEVNW